MVKKPVKKSSSSKKPMAKPSIPTKPPISAKPLKGDKASTSAKTSTASKTSTATRTATSTDAYTQGNITVTGGAGAGATKVSIGLPGGSLKNNSKKAQKAGGKKEKDES